MALPGLSGLIVVWWIAGGASVLVRSDETVVQIQLKKAVNVVSDEFVSFVMDPQDIVRMHSDSRNVWYKSVDRLAPAYIKIAHSDGQLTWAGLTDVRPNSNNNKQITSEKLQSICTTLSSSGLTPIFTLAYDPLGWKAREAIQILGSMATDTNVVWQLGADLNGSNPINYIDDLATLRQISDSLGGDSWGVIGADILQSNSLAEVRLYVELSQHIVDATALTNANEFDSLDHDEDSEKEPTLDQALQFSSRPVWMTIGKAHAKCASTEECTKQGLDWADTLGASALSGYQVIFQQLNDHDFEQQSLDWYVSVLHKRLMGNTVFETRMRLNSDTQLYAHCTRNMSGAFTVMGVNFGDAKGKVSTKLPHKLTGSTVMQYILKIDRNNVVLLNDKPVCLECEIMPLLKTRKLNRPTSFTLPAKSVGFWVFPEANVKDCLQSEFPPDEPLVVRPKTSSERLLQELILDSVNRSHNISSNGNKRDKRHLVVKKDFTSYRQKRFSPTMNMLAPFHWSKFRPFGRSLTRNKRQLGPHMNKLFGKFELPKKFNVPPMFKLGPLSIPPVVSTMHDVYKINSKENPFKSDENMELPDKDVFLEVGPDQNQDYVAFDEPQTISEFRDMDEDVDVEVHHYPVVYSDGSVDDEPNQYVRPSGDEVVYAKNRANAIYSSPDIVGRIVPAIEPTWQENQEHLRKAKNDLQKMYQQAEQSALRKNTPLQSNSYLDSMEKFFLSKRRRRRSIDQSFNDQIEKKISRHIDNEMTGKTAASGKLPIGHFKKQLLKKMFQLISDLQNLVGENDENGLNTLTNELKLLEKGTTALQLQRFGLASFGKSKPDSLKQQCKILAVTLEQQCNREMAPRQMNSLSKRALKNMQQPKRIRRKAEWNPAWSEQDLQTNMIHRDGELPNDPMVSLISTVYMDDNGMTHEYPVSFISTNDYPPETDKVLEATGTTTESIHSETTEHFESPKFMKSFTKSVGSLMDVVNFHVSRWWHFIS